MTKGNRYTKKENEIQCHFTTFFLLQFTKLIKFIIIIVAELEPKIS